jgi:hypothetical protein
MSGIGDIFKKRYVEPGAFGDESAGEGEDQAARTQRRVEKAQFDRSKNLGKHLHPKKEPVESPADEPAEGLGMKFRINAKKVAPRAGALKPTKPEGSFGRRG